MSKIILKGHIQLPINGLQSVVEVLENHKKLTLAEEGCLTFQVAPSSEIKGQFEVYEEFVNREAFDYHQARVRLSYWGKISANFERAYEVFEE